MPRGIGYYERYTGRCLLHPFTLESEKVVRLICTLRLFEIFSFIWFEVVGCRFGVYT